MSAQLDVLLPQITTYAQATKALLVANEFLAKASDATAGLDGVFERDAFNAAQSSIDQQRGYIKKILADLPAKDGPIDARTRSRVTTSLKQTEKTLNVVTTLAADDKNILEQFLEALAKVVQAVVAPILGGTWKLWVPALIIGLVIYLIVRRK